MHLVQSITTVDAHTMGEPIRIIMGGFPQVKGSTMPEKREYLQNQLDHLRTALMHEPRGHNDMFGALIVPPTSSEADLGILFMESGGYLNMCGHGTIGAVTVALETGLMEKKEPYTKLMLDTPAGTVQARAEVENNRVKRVTFRNVPAFVYRTGVAVEVPAVGHIKVDIAFGGSFFAILEAEQLSLELAPGNAGRIIETGLAILKAVNEQINVTHPVNPHIKTIDLVEMYGKADNPTAHCKNAVVFGEGSLDRSPCGTGTCAKMSLMHHKDQLALNEPFIHESIIGTLFEGRLAGKTKLGEYSAVVPEITGQAFITGFQQFVIDPEDPLKYGFILG